MESPTDTMGSPTDMGDMSVVDNIQAAGSNRAASNKTVEQQTRRPGRASPNRHRASPNRHHASPNRHHANRRHANRRHANRRHHAAELGRRP
jgi:hypothetical protein